MYKSDTRLTSHLHAACLTTELQNDGTNLGSTGCANGMAF
jgi:hypothetical protein